MGNDLKTSYPAVAVKDDRVIIRSTAATGKAPKLQAFDAADPFGLAGRMSKGEKVVLPKAAIEEIEQPPAPPMKTKINQVIEFLTEHGKTDTHTLRGVLGIKGRSGHPLSYLQDALSDRRIARSGNSWWVPGCEHVKAPGVEENQADIRRQLVSQLKQLEQSAIETAHVVVEAAKPEVQTTILDDDEYHGYLNMPRQAVEEAREVLKEERKAGEFACALWSDGELQLVRNGNTVATLSPDEADHLSKYLKRTAMEAA